jgi:hypothetical protein
VNVNLSDWVKPLAVLLTAGLALGQGNPFREGIELYDQGQYQQAAGLLAPVAAGTDESEERARALYLLASISSIQGQPARAEESLKRLLDVESGSSWAPLACAALMRSAVAAKAWDRAEELTARFLNLYLPLESAAIGDRVCTRMWEQLLTCARQQAPASSMQEIRRSLRKRYPPTSAAGRVVDYYGGADPDDPTANLVINPGFEVDQRAVGLPAGWMYRGTEPKPMDDYDGTIGTTGIIKPHEGKFCAGKLTNYFTHRGWLYQRVAVKSGHRYAVAVYGMTPAPNSTPGTLRLGVDPRGQTDPEAKQVRWTKPTSSPTEYRRIALEGPDAVQAEGDRITVFLELRQDTPVPPNAMLFDDVSVKQAD